MKQREELTGLQVFVRVRPPIRSEVALDNAVTATGNNVRVCGERHDVTCSYDHVFNELTDQDQVFLQVKPVLDGVLKGVNGCVFAYGQTSAGKSYTMLGPNGGQDLQHLPRSKWGILPRAADYLLGSLADLAEEGLMTYTVKCSFLQIYNESLLDLLRAADGTEQSSTSGLKIREVPMDMSTSGGTGAQEVYVAGLSEYRVHTAEDVLQLLHRGTTCRTTASTDYNATSSRSHAILQLAFELTSNVPGQGQVLTRCKLSLVDLAGSEKMSVATTGLPTLQGDLIEVCAQLQEAKHVRELTSINKSLSALGNVINALTAPNRPHIPYRDSKLTRLLQDSLGGNTKTVLIACVAPTAAYAAESASTLQFADRARSVLSRVKANVVSAGSVEGYKVALERANAEIERLKGLLARAMARASTNGGGGDEEEEAEEEGGSEEKSDGEGQSAAVVKRLMRENKRLRLEIEMLRGSGAGADSGAGSGAGAGTGGWEQGGGAQQRLQPKKAGGKKLRAIIDRDAQNSTRGPLGGYSASFATAAQIYGSGAATAALASASAPPGSRERDRDREPASCLSAAVALDRRLSAQELGVRRELKAETERLQRISDEKAQLQRLLQGVNSSSSSSSAAVAAMAVVGAVDATGSPQSGRAVSPISGAAAVGSSVSASIPGPCRGSAPGSLRQAVQAASHAMQLPPSPTNASALAAAAAGAGAVGAALSPAAAAAPAQSVAVSNFSSSIARLKAQAAREKEKKKALMEQEELIARLALPWQQQQQQQQQQQPQQREQQQHEASINNYSALFPAAAAEAQAQAQTDAPLCFSEEDGGRLVQLFSFRKNLWENVRVLGVRLDVGADQSFHSDAGARGAARARPSVLHLVAIEGSNPCWADLRRKPVRWPVVEEDE